MYFVASIYDHLNVIGNNADFIVIFDLNDIIDDLYIFTLISTCDDIYYQVIIMILT